MCRLEQNIYAIVAKIVFTYPAGCYNEAKMCRPEQNICVIVANKVFT
jgi:hypothetical protein